MGDPFRDEQNAALMRAARLEEENERLRRELEEAKRPKPDVKPKPPLRLGALFGAGVALLVTIAVILAARDTEHHRDFGTLPKALEPAPTAPAVVAPQREWEETPHVVETDLNAFAHGFVPSVGYAVGNGGTILRRYGDSAEWTVETSNTTSDLFAVDEQLGHVCAVGAGGVATCSMDPATPSWKVEKTGTTADLLAITSDNGVVAVGRRGTILRREDGAWIPEASGTKQDLRAIDEDYAVGSGGTILHYDRTRQKWESVPSGTTEDLFGVAQRLDDVVIVGAHGTILRRGDPRAGFHAEPSGVTSDLRSVTAGSAYSFLAAGAGGVVLVSHSPGTWSRMETGTQRDLHAVVGSIPTMVAVGDHGTILSRRY